MMYIMSLINHINQLLLFDYEYAQDYDKSGLGKTYQHDKKLMPQGVLSSTFEGRLLRLQQMLQQDMH